MPKARAHVSINLIAIQSCSLHFARLRPPPSIHDAAPRRRPAPPAARKDPTARLSLSFGQLPPASHTTFRGSPGLRATYLCCAEVPSYPQLQRWGVRALLTLAAGDLPDAAATPVRWEEARTPYDA